jgi:hypothetical protein
MPDGTTEETNELADRPNCGWTYKRWDGEFVRCTLKLNHTKLFYWPHHAPNMPVIKPWKQTVVGDKKFSE